MKTKNAILTDIWQIISAGAIGALSGGVYKNTRPTDSELEDCVIRSVSGNTAKFLQNGALYVQIFYKDIFVNNINTEDTANGQTIEQLLIDLSEELLALSAYSFEIQSRETYTEAVQDVKILQHYAILKMNFLITYD